MFRRCGMLLSALLFFSGCELRPQVDLPNDELPDDVGGTLKAFSSEGELRDYFRGQIADRNDDFSGSNVLESGDEVVGAPEADGAGGGAADGPTAAPSSPVDATAGVDDVGAISLNGEFDGRHSATTTQEVGVDEADVVKTDGTNLYIIDDSTGENTTLRIVRANPPDQLSVLGEVALEGYGRELYLNGNRLVAVTADYGGIVFIDSVGVGVVASPETDVRQIDAESGDAGASTDPTSVNETGADDPVTSDDSAVMVDGSVGVEPINGVVDAEPPSDSGDDDVLPSDDIGILPIDPPFSYTYRRPSLTVTVIDASDPSSPTVLSRTRFDGSPSSSRMIDGVLQLVIANYQHYFFDVMPRLGFVDFNPEIVDTELLLPRFEHIDAAGNVTTGDVLTWEQLYRPVDPDGFGVVSIVSMDTNASADASTPFRAVGIVAEPGLIYSSIEALYLTNTAYDFTGQMRTTTNVYKFDYVDGRAVPAAAGSVPGRVLNQYSMGEFQGVLRVATTIDPIFSETGEITRSSNAVYTLGEDAGTLNVLGSIENIAPRETIQSARFLGDRGYVVTFEQIDPLFTLDLADPTNPRIIGELKVPGFSTFIVPMDRDHLLTVGQYIPDDGIRFNWGVQLSIFDVSDFANPVQTHNVVIGDAGGAYSEALYDPKAFTYFAEEGLVALPVSIYEYSALPSTPIPMDAVGTDDDASDPSMVDADGGADGSDGTVNGSDDMTTIDPNTGEAPEESIAAGEPTVIQQGFDGLVVFRVSAAEGFSELGRISTRFEQPGYYSYNSYTRGVFIEDNVYAVTNQGLRTAPVSNVSTPTAELFYGTLYPIFEFPVFDDVISLPPFEEGMSEGDVAAGSGGSEGSVGTGRPRS